jgi:hypothetical protein
MGRKKPVRTGKTSKRKRATPKKTKKKGYGY